MLTKEQIQEADDLIYEEEDVPEWGGKVRIKTMTGTERDSFESTIYQIQGDKAKIVRDNFRANLLARCLIDENGNRLFSDKEINQLGKKNGSIINRLFIVAQRVNALTKEDEDDLVKNLSSEEDDGSISSSQSS